MSAEHPEPHPAEHPAEAGGNHTGLEGILSALDLEKRAQDTQFHYILAAQVAAVEALGKDENHLLDLDKLKTPAGKDLLKTGAATYLMRQINEELAAGAPGYDMSKLGDFAQDRLYNGFIGVTPTDIAAASKGGRVPDLNVILEKSKESRAFALRPFTAKVDVQKDVFEDDHVRKAAYEHVGLAEGMPLYEGFQAYAGRASPDNILTMLRVKNAGQSVTEDVLTKLGLYKAPEAEEPGHAAPPHH